MKTRSVVALILIVVLVGVSVFVAWDVPLPKKLPAVAWNSAWVFHAEVFVGFFVSVYVLFVVAIGTIVSGRPPQKLSFGLLAYENAEIEKAVDALTEGGETITAITTEVSEINKRLNDTIGSARTALRQIAELATAIPDAQHINRQAIEALDSLPSSNLDERQTEVDEALKRLQDTLSELETMRAVRSRQ